MLKILNAIIKNRIRYGGLCALLYGGTFALLATQTGLSTWPLAIICGAIGGSTIAVLNAVRDHLAHKAYMAEALEQLGKDTE